MRRLLLLLMLSIAATMAAASDAPVVRRLPLTCNSSVPDLVDFIPGQGTSPFPYASIPALPGRYECTGVDSTNPTTPWTWVLPTGVRLSGGGGGVSSFSAGTASPLFSTSVATATTTPALSFTISSAGAHQFYGNNTGGSAAPAFVQPAAADLSDGVTGTGGSVVLANSPTLVTPSLGAATATSLSTNGSNGGIDGTEGTEASLTAAVGHDLFAPDSTSHCWKQSLNNGSWICTPLLAGDLGNTAASPQVQSTHLSSALPVAQGGWQLATLTAHALYAGNGASAPTAIGPDAATTKALFSAGSSADPAFRAIAAADLPASLSSSTSVNGTTIPSSVTLTQTIASGTSALATGAISSGTCATAVTTAATGTATTDNVMADFNADPTAVTGYAPSASGMLTIIKYPTANNVNFKVCNNTAGSVTPGAITLNWRVVR